MTQVQRKHSAVQREEETKIKEKDTWRTEKEEDKTTQKLLKLKNYVVFKAFFNRIQQTAPRFSLAVYVWENIKDCCTDVAWGYLVWDIHVHTVQKKEKMKSLSYYPRTSATVNHLQAPPRCNTPSTQTSLLWVWDVWEKWVGLTSQIQLAPVYMDHLQYHSHVQGTTNDSRWGWLDR